MDKPIADRAARPSAPEEGDIAIETLAADLADPGFYPQEHRFPFPAGLSKTHGGEYTQALRGKTRRPAGLGLFDTPGIHLLLSRRVSLVLKF